MNFQLAQETNLLVMKVFFCYSSNVNASKNDLTASWPISSENKGTLSFQMGVLCSNK